MIITRLGHWHVIDGPCLDWASGNECVPKCHVLFSGIHSMVCMAISVPKRSFYNRQAIKQLVTGENTQQKNLKVTSNFTASIVPKYKVKRNDFNIDPLNSYEPILSLSIWIALRAHLL